LSLAEYEGDFRSALGIQQAASGIEEGEEDDHARQ